jgi:SHS2 domain-containing protein
VPYEFFDQAGNIGVTVQSDTLAGIFAHASSAFSGSITALGGIEPKRPEEVDVDAPELDLLLLDFLTELLYRYDTRGWLTREAEVELHEKDGGWSLQGTLRGERLNPSRHVLKAAIKAVTYQGLHVHQTEGVWTAQVVFVVL